MNRLKVWLYTALVAVAGCAALVVLSQALTHGTLAQIDRHVAAGAAQADLRLQFLGEQAGRVAERMARDPALSHALTAEAGEADLTRALAVALRDDPSEAAGLAVAAVGSRGPARFAGSSPAPELERLLSAARDGRRVETDFLARGTLHRAVGLPVGLGAAVAVAVPATSAWLRQMRAATACEVTLAIAAKPIESTLPPGQAALVAGAAPAGGGATLAAGVLAPQPLSLPWKVPLPPLPLLFAEAPAHRVGAVALQGVPAGALVLSQAVAGPLSLIVTCGWLGLAGLALLVLIGLVVGLLVKDEQRVAFPKELLIAADRIGRGDFTARAPVLAGRLGTIAGALNRAAEAAWTPPSPAPPTATGAAPLGAAELSSLPAAPRANSFLASPAAAEPAPWAERDGAAAGEESVPPAGGSRVGGAAGRRAQSFRRDSRPAGRGARQRGRRARERLARAARVECRQRPGRAHRRTAPSHRDLARLLRPPAARARRRAAGRRGRGALEGGIRRLPARAGRLRRAARGGGVRALPGEAAEEPGSARRAVRVPDGALPGVRQGRQGGAQGQPGSLSRCVALSRASTATATATSTATSTDDFDRDFDRDRDPGLDPALVPT